MYASPSFQNIRLTSASTFPELESVPFTIKFESTNSPGSWGDVCFHIGNAPLAVALVKAINDTLAAFADNTGPAPDSGDAKSDRIVDTDDILF
jgi:hypothetical protein